MAKVEIEKKEFDPKDAIKLAASGLKKKDPHVTYKNEEIEEMIGARFIKLMERTGGVNPREAAADCANKVGVEAAHFSFDRYRPFSKEEVVKHNLTGHDTRQIKKALDKIRANERRTMKAEWEKKRRIEIQIFSKYFLYWLKKTYGDHIENKMGMKVAVGESVEIKKGHYHKLYSGLLWIKTQTTF